MHLSSDPIILFLGSYLGDAPPAIQITRGTLNNVPCVNAKYRKSFKCPCTGEWLKKLWDIHSIKSIMQL